MRGTTLRDFAKNRPVRLYATRHTLYRKLQRVLSEVVVEPMPEQRRPGPRDIPYGIPEHEWQVVLARVANHESYRTIAKDYQVSRETIRRVVQAAKEAS